MRGSRLLAVRRAFLFFGVAPRRSCSALVVSHVPRAWAQEQSETDVVRVLLDYAERAGRGGMEGVNIETGLCFGVPVFADTIRAEETARFYTTETCQETGTEMTAARTFAGQEGASCAAGPDPCLMATTCFGNLAGWQAGGGSRSACPERGGSCAS